MKQYKSKVLLLVLSMGLQGSSCTKKDIDITERDRKVEIILQPLKFISEVNFNETAYNKRS